jgi:uncharacterized protein (DUF1501 family)
MKADAMNDLSTPRGAEAPDTSADTLSRRMFLRRSGQLGLAGTAMPFAINLAAMGEAAAFSASDYKALVCVFLYGGNDYANTVVPIDDASYDKYHAIRSADGSSGLGNRGASGIALAQSALAATALNPTVPLAGGRQYALHPSLVRLAQLFNGGQAAVQLNVGPLRVPLTRDQYKSSNRQFYPLPPKLFSHNDQQSIWQSSSPEGSTIGWGGNMGDLALGSNTDALFTCINLTGNAVFLSGDMTLSYQVSTGGAVAINGTKSNIYGSSAVKTAFTSIVQQTSSHNFENEYNRVTRRAITAESKITSALAGLTLATSFDTDGQTNNLADQMKMVARLIAARNTLGNKRQVFLVSIGGFDLHDNLISQHPGLLGRVDEAVSAFYDATVELGVSDKVTTFTASDFGRTLSSNGDGSDHGWGSHHLVVGGAVRGKAFYGKAPPISVGNTTAPEDQFHVGQGRLLPTTSVDQYAATLARWFGVNDTEMSSVLPNIGRFGAAAGFPDYPTDLGFMI